MELIKFKFELKFNCLIAAVFGLAVLGITATESCSYCCWSVIPELKEKYPTESFSASQT